MKSKRVNKDKGKFLLMFYDVKKEETDFRVCDDKSVLEIYVKRYLKANNQSISAVKIIKLTAKDKIVNYLIEDINI